MCGCSRRSFQLQRASNEAWLIRESHKNCFAFCRFNSNKSATRLRVRAHSDVMFALNCTSLTIRVSIAFVYYFNTIRMRVSANENINFPSAARSSSLNWISPASSYEKCRRKSAGTVLQDVIKRPSSKISVITFRFDLSVVKKFMKSLKEKPVFITRTLTDFKTRKRSKRLLQAIKTFAMMSFIHT